MTPWMALVRIALAVACAVCAPMAPVASEGSKQVQIADDDWLTFFYRDPRPGRLVGFLDNLQGSPKSQNWNVYPPLVGIYAIVFRTHPDWIERLLPQQPKADSVAAIGAALRLAGLTTHAEKLRPVGPGDHPNARLQSELSALPNSIQELRVATATHLDILWGASFASGEERYVQMIIEFLARTANRSEPIAIDVAKTAVALAGGPKGILSELKDRHGDALAREIIVAAVALWALRSNSARHVFIERSAARYVEQHVTTPAAKAIAALRPKQGRAE